MEAARTVKDVYPHEFVKAYALPHWTDIVKTTTFKELAPYDPDWYYIRAIYGGRKTNGSRPPHFCKNSGSIFRHILQQIITASRQRDLDQVAGRIVVAHLVITYSVF
uniref:40S ribosomal protein S19-3-like n=1 Tax=Nelumbo nucifera TaxID=4432 RepID=A0A822XQ98_NELNU|nr:TPA_asm: hypothetical protein HUJ06_024073 [Nelumbo nucifera]